MTESRSSDRKLKPLPPDPARHQDSAIALAFNSFVGFRFFCHDPLPARQRDHEDRLNGTFVFIASAAALVDASPISFACSLKDLNCACRNSDCIRMKSWKSLASFSLREK